MRCSKLFRLAIVASSLSALGLAGCEPSRDRPTGLGRPVPPTRVTVVQPASDQLVPADSVRTIVVEAAGSLLAVEVHVLRPSISDTIMRERRDFETEQSSIEEEFTLQVPSFVTGTHLEIRAVAEDIIGQRHSSEPVFVQVIECDVFPLACGDL